VTLEARIEALFAAEPAALADPFSVYDDVRAAGRVFELGPTVLLTHYDDVKWALREGDRLSNKALSEGSRVEATRARFSGDARDAFDEVIAFEANFVSRTDGADHDRLRRIAHRAFTPRRIAELEAATRRYADELLATLAEQETADVMVLAYRLPLMIVADLLGVPEADRELIHAWSEKLGAANASTDPGPYLEARVAIREFRAYLDEMLDRHRREPDSTDLVAVLMDAEGDERMNADELAALYVQILFAGHETTTNLIGAGLLGLLRHPDEWRALTQDRTLIPLAVEELMRFVTPTQFVSRLAVEEIELAGVAIPEGRTILAVLAGAHRDAAVFADPGRLDVRRPEGRQQLGFGFGPHFCLGSALARLEAQVVLDLLARRFPHLALAADTVEWEGSAMLRHLTCLPVAWGDNK
jgi:cytochrome P450